MNDDTRRVVEFVTAQFVFVAGLIHLTLGIANWLRWVDAGFLLPRDVRWPLFVVSGGLVLGGLYSATRRERDRRRPFYAAGIVVMAGYVLGYFGWHLGGHRPLLLLGQGVGGEAISVAWFLDHLFAGPVEFVSIAVETIAAVGFAVLLADAGE